MLQKKMYKRFIAKCLSEKFCSSSITREITLLITIFAIGKLSFTELRDAVNLSTDFNGMAIHLQLFNALMLGNYICCTLYSNFMCSFFLRIFLHTVIWYQIFLSNKNNLHTVVWFQVFLSNTNNYMDSSNYFNLIGPFFTNRYMVDVTNNIP